MLSHFHRHHLDFDSILVFNNLAEIPRMDLARLSDASLSGGSRREFWMDLGKR